jgi:hypothetical protein
MAAVAAIAVRDQQRLVENRKRSQQANATSKAEAARREMAASPLDFAKALKALRAQRAAEISAMERQRPTLLALSADGSPEEVVGPSGKVYSSTSICCMRPYHHPRKLAIWVCESWFFDPAILLTIMCNCLTMAWESPLDPCCTPKARFIEVRVPFARRVLFSALPVHTLPGALPSGCRACPPPCVRSLLTPPPVKTAVDRVGVSIYFYR